MPFNFLIFLLLFLIFSFFITFNLFFERSFQQDALELSHKELGLLTQNLGEKLSFLLNIVPNKYYSFSKYLENQKGASKIDKKFIQQFLIQDVKEITSLLYEYKIEKIKEPPKKDLEIFINFSERKIVYFLPFKDPKGSFLLTLSVGMDEIFQKHLKPVQISPRGYAWLISKDGTLIYHPTQPDMIGNNIYKDITICLNCHKDFEAEKSILKENIEGSYNYYYSPEKIEKVIYYTKILVSGQEWFLCLSIPYEELLLPMNKSMKLHSLLIICIFLSMIIIGSLFYYLNVKRVSAEEKLKFYAFLESIIESTRSKIVVLDRKYNILLANKAYAKLLDRPKEEIVGINFFDVCPQKIETYKEILKNLMRKALNGEYAEFTGYPLRENGEVRYYHVGVNPLIEKGEITGIVLFCDDITEEIFLRNQIQEYANQLETLVAERTKELTLEKEKLSVIMNTIDSGICLIDEDGTITWMNPKLKDFIQKMERTRDIEIERVNICDLFLKIGDCLDPSQSNQFIYELLIDNEKRFFQIQITPLRSSEEKINFICLIQDITDFRLMEERIMQTEKLQALARISAGLAHEIGNPLTSISSYVQVLKEMDLGDFANQAFEVISKHILRISEIIKNISNFAKPTKGEIVPIKVQEVVEGALGLVKFDKRMKDIKIITKYEEVPEVLADPNQLSQVFINIILNASDAMPKGGELIIEVKREENFVIGKFTDTGMGISPENLSKIFDPFFTTKEKGTGLGLAVSYSIIKNLGGDIVVESTVGKGTTFTIKLPISQPEEFEG